MGTMCKPCLAKPNNVSKYFTCRGEGGRDSGRSSDPCLFSVHVFSVEQTVLLHRVTPRLLSVHLIHVFSRPEERDPFMKMKVRRAKLKTERSTGLV